eukprot:GDKK01063885.1.p1 GENE.GDKK01063885.1~~GDKK01063885.1.p1  ORF type:complete len:244 (+),score=26.23 GDKK01063885.1:1-732(+)
MGPMSRSLFLLSLLLFAAAAASEPINTGNGNKELDAARKLQHDSDHLSEELTTKMLELEVEYHKKKEPILKERGALLKSIPAFWPTIIKRHPNHRGWLKGLDDAILDHLIDVEISDLDREGSNYYPLHTFRLTMRFTANEFFSNKVLYRDVAGSLESEGSSGVDWMMGKAPTEASFFNFFEHNIPDTRVRMEDHIKHEIAHVFRYEFWQNPFTYYDQPNFYDFQHLSEEDYARYHEADHQGEL